MPPPAPMPPPRLGRPIGADEWPTTDRLPEGRNPAIPTDAPTDPGPLAQANVTAGPSVSIPLPAPSTDQVAAEDRSADARLARLHLRGGLVALARASLEQMAGAATLDRDAMADLAETRWRGGDLDGAADSARVHRASGGEEPMAALIEAESLGHTDHHGGAASLAEGVYRRVGPALELYFAGEVRSGLWPAADAGWMDGHATEPGRWGLLVGGSEVIAPTPRTWDAVPIVAVPAAAGLPGPVTPAGRGGIASPGGQTTTAAVVMSGRLAGEQLDEADRALSQGDTGAAAERLGVLLRLDPALAPVILSAADKAVAQAQPETAGLATIHLVRGDAYRILGRETEAAGAYAEAHQTLDRGSSSEEPV